MGFKEFLEVALVLFLNLLVLITFPAKLPDPPKQATNPLTGFPEWHEEKNDEFPEQDRSYGILTSVVTLIAAIVALKITAKSLTSPSPCNSYFYFKSNPPIPAGLFNRLLAFYSLSTFFTSIAYYVFDAGKIFSMFGAFHNFLEVAIMLLLHNGGKVISYLWYFGLLSVYFIVVQAGNIWFPWPYDALWFKGQGLTQDYALLILFFRIYFLTRRNLKDEASTELPITRDEDGEEQQTGGENDDNVDVNYFPPVVNHPREYLLILVAIFIHCAGNVTITFYPSDNMLNATQARKRIYLPENPPYKVWSIALWAFLFALITIRIAVFIMQKQAKDDDGKNVVETMTVTFLRKEVNNDIKQLIWPSSSTIICTLSFWQRLVLIFLKLSAFFAYNSARLPQFLGGSGYPTENVDIIQPYLPDKMLSPQRDESGDGKKLDKVAVVIPMHLNEERSKTRMKRLLEQLAWQTCVPNIVIVVDDCSSCQYQDSEILPENYELAVKIEKLKKRVGFAFARNRGIDIASKHYSPTMVLFTEIHCLPDIKWIEHALEAYDTRKRQRGFDRFLLCGQTRAIGNTLFDFYHNINGTLNGRFLPHHDFSMLYGTFVNFAAPLPVVSRIRFDDGFSEGAFDDVEFFVRAREFEVKTFPIPDMMVNYDFGYWGSDNNDIKYTVNNVNGVLEDQEEGEEQTVARWKEFVYFCRNYVMFFRLFRKFGVWHPLMLAKHPEFTNYLEISQEISIS
ncbi:5141_t:CDS:2 [Ambispora leptoticha]|uniref:5141_t:CDS:1 n=1 Tax=Ambispora leptoticha TaxID=144679 RepID=A0A9N8VDU7_9GLOM|nr:5141_t:CDS:2 [Ambispora leptoticha]